MGATVEDLEDEEVFLVVAVVLWWIELADVVVFLVVLRVV